MSSKVTGPSGLRMPELSSWSRALHAIASQPLALCEHWPRIAERFEAWWHGELVDRPLFIAAPANPQRGQAVGRRLELLTQPEAWLAAKLADMQASHWAGDSVPNIRVDFGPAMLGTLLGTPFHFQTDTTWFDTVIKEDWSNAQSWAIAPHNSWWKLLCELTERVAADAAGRYLLCAPAYEAAADVIANLRGATEFCLDIADRPERVRHSVEALYPVWRQVLRMLYEQTTRHGTGLTTWMRIWSSEPFTHVAADVGYMLSTDDFNNVILPSIVREAQTVGRAIFHVDGPPMWRHLDALLDVPQIQAFQFTPGAGHESVLPFIDTLRRIQAAKRSLLVFAPADEVLPLCEALNPAGLAILLDTVPPIDALQDLFQTLCARFGCSVALGQSNCL